MIRHSVCVFLYGVLLYLHSRNTGSGYVSNIITLLLTDRSFTSLNCKSPHCFIGFFPKRHFVDLCKMEPKLELLTFVCVKSWVSVSFWRAWGRWHLLCWIIVVLECKLLLQNALVLYIGFSVLSFALPSSSLSPDHSIPLQSFYFHGSEKLVAERYERCEEEGKEFCCAQFAMPIHEEWIEYRNCLLMLYLEGVCYVNIIQKAKPSPIVQPNSLIEIKLQK